MRITFLGAAGEVTGSSYLIEAGPVRFLLDCGMFQGGREAYQRNVSALVFEAHVGKPDFVLLTHAHIDHSGLLPRLASQGFSGPIYATPATCDLAAVLLLDSAHIQEKDQEWAERHRRKHNTGHKGNPPLYTVAQARQCLKQFRPVGYDVDFNPAPHLRIRFRDAGHILGAAIVELWITEAGRVTKLVLSGDLGQPARPVLRDPTPVEAADILLVESTYGNRLHKGLTETEDELVLAIKDTIVRKAGNVILPAFAVGRTQEVLFLLVDLVRRNRLPPVTIFVDSPMAEAATELTFHHRELLDDETRELIDWHSRHPDRPRIHFVREVEESMALNQVKSGAVIIAASGMCDAGRVKHHLRHNLGRPECSVVITGFQAAGTLGRRLVDGARRVRIFGEEIPVRADIYTIGGLSAHADRDALLSWLRYFRSPPRHCFIVHGEAATSALFAESVRALGWQNVVVPGRGDSVDFDPGVES